MNLGVGAIILWIVPIFVAHALGKSKRRSGTLLRAAARLARGDHPRSLCRRGRR